MASLLCFVLKNYDDGIELLTEGFLSVLATVRKQIILIEECRITGSEQYAGLKNIQLKLFHKCMIRASEMEMKHLLLPKWPACIFLVKISLFF